MSPYENYLFLEAAKVVGVIKIDESYDTAWDMAWDMSIEFENGEFNKPNKDLWECFIEFLTNFELTPKITWRDVFNTENLNGKDFSDMHNYVSCTGYKYFSWYSDIYQVSDDRKLTFTIDKL